MVVGGIIGTISMHFIHLNKKFSYNSEQTVKGIQSVPSKDFEESSVGGIQIGETQAKVKANEWNFEVFTLSINWSIFEKKCTEWITSYKI